MSLKHKTRCPSCGSGAFDVVGMRPDVTGSVRQALRCLQCRRWFFGDA